MNLFCFWQVYVVVVVVVVVCICLFVCPALEAASNHPAASGCCGQVELIKRRMQTVCLLVLLLPMMMIMSAGELQKLGRHLCLLTESIHIQANLSLDEERYHFSSLPIEHF